MDATSGKTYVIGDVQGCFDSLQALIQKIDLEARDQLWFVGDLVNRGPKSLEVLQYIKNLGSRAKVVLGNHDLHMLARYYGVSGAKTGDTLDKVLQSSECPSLMQWLIERPLLYSAKSWTMVHAGLDPSWTLEHAQKIANELSTSLRDPFLRLKMLDRKQAPHELKVLTTIRVCDLSGNMSSFNKNPQDAPIGFGPWYSHPNRKTQGQKVIFGHWSALGLMVNQNIVALDTGCVWGGCLTAIDIEDKRVIQQPSLENLSS